MKVNLLPREAVERQRSRRQTTGVIAFGVLLLALLGGFFVLQTIKLNGLREDIATQEAENDRLEAEIAELRQFAALQEELIRTRELLNTVLADEVRWSGVLRDVSLVIPGNVWLESMNAAVTPTGDGAAPAAEGLIGQINFTGVGLSHRAAALWLSRLEDVEGFANPWLSTSQKGVIGVTEVVNFSSSVDLSNLLLVRAPGVPG